MTGEPNNFAAESKIAQEQQARRRPGFARFSAPLILLLGAAAVTAISLHACTDPSPLSAERNAKQWASGLKLDPDAVHCHSCSFPYCSCDVAVGITVYSLNCNEERCVRLR
jgi:hypothetical protein